MSRFLAIAAYLLFTSFLTRLGCIAGWGYDPGYVGPMLLIIAASFMLAIYNDS